MEHRDINEIESEIAELKSRWPPHSVPPTMWQQLEDLEDELKKAEAARKEKHEGVFDTHHGHKLDEPGRLKELRPLELLRDFAGVAPGMTCIDFGSGTGTFTIPMAELTGTHGKVYAVDRSDELLEQLKQKSPPSNVIPVKADVEKTGLDGRIADICLLSSILHELKQPGNLFTEAARVLKPGGRIVIVEWKAELEAPGPPRNLRISRRQLDDMAEKNGMSVLKYTDWSANYYAALVA